jgi:hypothetical protein
MFRRFGHAETVDLNCMFALRSNRCLFNGRLRRTSPRPLLMPSTLVTARNLDGRGVRVVVVGEKGKGSAEV